ncbi:MAG: acyl-CoA synthetase [Rhodanobacter sp.]|nr:MAG: acyl-CoA synthetase [Rhodanobacter sp.]TAM10006.1 MAG: acyl-CoA synthetase [Rhodanobacter sp.]TAM34701.1 MAG: acyl-CoA synthetase [Rhodanobacter sp.]
MIELPTILGVHRDGDDCTVTVLIRRDLAFLVGHFPGHPVVPGAVQVGWALTLAAQYLGTPAACRDMEALKFQRLLLPGQQVTLSLRFDHARNKLHFSWLDGATAYSSGRLVLEQPA